MIFNKRSVIESDWFKFTVCIECQIGMSEHIRMHNHGLCNRCGHNSKSTVCDTKDIILKKISHKIENNKWWQYWKPEYTHTYIGKDEASQKWVNEKDALYDKINEITLK